MGTHQITTSSPRANHANRVHMQLEKLWKVVIPKSIHNKEFELHGRPDYAFWYGRIEETELNVVVVEAKHQDQPGLKQCLAYMGTYYPVLRTTGSSDEYLASTVDGF
ncbi:hypothetical protein N7540_011835 [Penicillium herquei]|nr:hypothetical protein N7540_011835 [Penicillium herquei]